MKKTILLIFVLIYFINSANAQWQECGPGNGLVCIYLNGSTIFAGSHGMGIYKSTNNGDTWSIVSNGLPGFIGTGDYDDVTAIARKENNIFVGTQNCGIYMSTDSGANWYAVNNGITDLNITSLAVHDSIIFAGTDYGGGIFSSADNGAHWAAVNNGLSNPYVSSLAVKGSSIYAGTQYWNGGVFKSTNNGANWSLISAGLPQETVREIAIKDTTDVFVAYPSHGIYFTDNSGTTWSKINNGLADTNILSIKVCNSIVFTGTSLENIFLSTDDGMNWSPFNDNLVGCHPIWDFAINESYIFAIDGGGNGLLRRLIKDIVTYNEVDTDNAKFVLYPNPTSDKLFVDFKLSVKSHIKVKMFDMMGKQIMNTMEGYWKDDKIELDIGRCATGMYMLKIETADKIYDYKISKE